MARLIRWLLRRWLRYPGLAWCARWLVPLAFYGLAAGSSGHGVPLCG